MVDTDDTRRTIDEGRWTTPGVWHKLPTGELKMTIGPKSINFIRILNIRNFYLLRSVREIEFGKKCKISAQNLQNFAI